MRRILLALTLLATLACHPTSSYKRMVDTVSASVVRLSYASGGVCTGFVIAPHRVLTAGHCVGDDTTYVDGVAATVVLTDKFDDLALLDVPTTKAPLYLRDRRVAHLESLTGIGYAFGWNVLMVWRESVVFVNRAPYEGIATGIITQGQPIKGMSGGPIVDDAGLVVGVTQQGTEGAGYGVGTLIIRAFLLGAEGEN